MGRYAFDPNVRRRIIGDNNASFTGNDADITVCITQAESMIDAWCGRRFDLDADVSERSYRPGTSSVLLVDDIGTSTGLLVSTGGLTDWTALTADTDFWVDQRNGQPITQLFGSWPIACYGYPTVKVTARWGWPAVPEPVKAAAELLATRLFKRRDAPLGVAGFDQIGVMPVMRIDPDISAALQPFMNPAMP